MVTSTTSEFRVCPTCGAAASTAYCGACGEKRLGHHHLTLVGILAHAGESLFHVDGRVFRSLRTLLLRPGILTAACLRGARKSLFLEAVFVGWAYRADRTIHRSSPIHAAAGAALVSLRSCRS
jgi:hypothetical protein